MITSDEILDTIMEKRAFHYQHYNTCLHSGLLEEARFHEGAFIALEQLYREIVYLRDKKDEYEKPQNL